MKGNAMSDERMMMIFDFSTEEQFRQWMVINDGVMGGSIAQHFHQGRAGRGRVCGSVSLENYGGFCSVSSRQPAPVDASAFSGIAVRCKGDGKTYKLTLKNDSSFGGFSYQFRFAVSSHEWMLIKAPFSEFKASFRGQPSPEAPPLNPGVIQAIGFLIADKQAGAFELQVESIQAYKE